MAFPGGLCIKESACNEGVLVVAVINEALQLLQVQWFLNFNPLITPFKRQFSKTT